MGILKKGTITQENAKLDIMITAVYECSECGEKDTRVGTEINDEIICSKCKNTMKVISSSCSPK